MKDSRSPSIAIKSSTFLKDIEQSAMQAILASAEIRHISATRTITTGGDDATHLFLVQTGRVHYYHVTKEGDSVLLAWLAPGDIIGLVAMMRVSSPYMATAEANTDCELLAWKRSVIRKLAARFPLLGENGLQIALGYLRAYIDRHIGLVTKTAEQRLAEALLRLSDRCGEVLPDGIEIRATNEQLGELAEISEFTASRLLSNWVRAGILSKRRGKVLIQSPEALMIG
jgi:CRP-like cAMP-binding protein